MTKTPMNKVFTQEQIACIRGFADFLQNVERKGGGLRMGVGSTSLEDRDEPNLCGTVLCVGGWAAVYLNKYNYDKTAGNRYYGYTQGADALAHELGFKNADAFDIRWRIETAEGREFWGGGASKGVSDYSMFGLTGYAYIEHGGYQGADNGRSLTLSQAAYKLRCFANRIEAAQRKKAEEKAAEDKAAEDNKKFNEFLQEHRKETSLPPPPRLHQDDKPIYIDPTNR